MTQDRGRPRMRRNRLTWLEDVTIALMVWLATLLSLLRQRAKKSPGGDEA